MAYRAIGYVVAPRIRAFPGITHPKLDAPVYLAIARQIVISSACSWRRGFPMGLLHKSAVATATFARGCEDGARRVWHDVLAEGLSCGLHRVERLMRENGLRARPQTSFQNVDHGPRASLHFKSSRMSITLRAACGESRPPPFMKWRPCAVSHHRA